MPVIAYQSLNSNASTEHNVDASNSQYFTRMAHNKVASSTTDAWKLKMPTAPVGVSPYVPILGPPHLVESAPQGFMKKGAHDNATFLSMVENKARQSLQNLHRAFGGCCDIIVFGELDSSNTAWSSMEDHAGPRISHADPDKACNCFSVHTSAQTGVHQPVGSGEGWIAMKCYNILVVFVHVPNAIAKSKSACQRFYTDIQNTLLQAGAGAIDLIMGDTNQSSPGFTHTVVSAALNTTFVDAHPASDIQPFDTLATSFGGTNATGTKKYDVAVYNTSTVTVKGIIYLSQFVSTESGAAAMTDHMGIGVHMEK